MIYVPQGITDFTYSNIVSTVPNWNGDIVTSGSFIIGSRYQIISIGTTNFMLIGASSNTVGLVFTATGVGAGTGTAQTAYFVGDLARIGSRHYKSLSGTATLPNVDTYPLTNNTAWYDYEVSNTYACLDYYEYSRTTWETDGKCEFSRYGKEVIGIGNFKASLVTIEYLDSIGAVLDTETYQFGTSGNTYGPYSYIYSPITTSVGYIIFKNLLKKGVTIRVTFSNGGNATDCGFLTAGRAYDMGKTLDEVSLQEQQIGSRIAKIADFSTVLDQKDLTRKLSEARALGDQPLMFVIDPTETSMHQNLVILGTFTSRSGTANNFTKNVADWQIQEIVLT